MNLMMYIISGVQFDLNFPLDMITYRYFSVAACGTTI
jgi:hypothetical protein